MFLWNIKCMFTFSYNLNFVFNHDFGYIWHVLRDMLCNSNGMFLEMCLKKNTRFEIKIFIIFLCFIPNIVLGTIYLLLLFWQKPLSLFSYISLKPSHDGMIQIFEYWFHIVMGTIICFPLFVNVKNYLRNP